MITTPTVTYPNPLAICQLPAHNPDFVWKSAKCNGGGYYPVRSMETRHLFYTLRMIWNHRMPEQYRIQPYRQYRLMYSDLYLKDALYAIAGELATRNDLIPQWVKQLNVMASYFNGIAKLNEGG